MTSPGNRDGGPAGSGSAQEVEGAHRLAMVDARAGDDAFLFELFCSTRREEMAGWNWPPGEQQSFLELQHRAQRAAYAQQYPEAQNQIVLWDRERVGRRLTARTAEAIALVDLALMPGFRNRGLGTALIRDLQTSARAEGRGVCLHVLMYNPARRLYERLGFRENGGNLPYVRMQWFHDSAAVLGDRGEATR